MEKGMCVDPARQGRTLVTAATAASLTDSDLTKATLDASQVLTGSPDLRHKPPFVSTDLCVGLRQHCVAASTDVEADKIVVVLCGQPAVGIKDSPPIDGGAGDVGILTAGTRTTWTVHETLRRVYVVRP
jgi:hypothetical protein